MNLQIKVHGINILKKKEYKMYTLKEYKDSNYKKYSKSNLPMKYINKDIEDFKILGDEKEKIFNQKNFDMFMDYYKNVEFNLKKGRGIIISGSVGIGKTLLLTYLSKKIIEIFEIENLKIQDEELGIDIKYNKLYYIQATTLSQMIFSSVLNEKELSIRRGIKTIACLWIDDVSKIQQTKTSIEINFLDDILRYRELNNLTTIYTSQVPFEELISILSIPIYDMIKGSTLQLVFRGDSQR